MKIKSILNNSALIALNEKNEEVILIGRGISFNKHPKDEVDASKVEKVFQMNSQKTNELIEVINTIPEEYLEITSTIIKHAKKKLKKELDQNVYITMSDHIFSAIERYHDGIELSYGMMNELKQLYPQEYEIAKWALDYVNAMCDVDLPQDECGFMAIHIIGAESQDTDLSFAKKVMKIVKDISDEVIVFFDGKINQESLAYSRFITHLKYFAIRYIKHEQIEHEDISFSFHSDMDDVNQCIEKITELMSNKYNYKLSEYEENYLILHINRLIKK